MVTAVTAPDLSSCCSEPIDDGGRCEGCGEAVGECRDCGGEGVVEMLVGSQAGLDSPRTRTVACETCQPEDDYDEPDYDPDDGERPYARRVL